MATADKPSKPSGKAGSAAATAKSVAAANLKAVADAAQSAAAKGSKPAAHFALKPNLTPDLGRLISVLMASPIHRRMSVADAALMLLPAIGSGQYLVGEAKDKDGGPGGAIAFILWAKVADAVDKRMRSDPKLARPAYNEWSGGENFWIVDTVGPPGVIRAMLRQSLKSRFAGKPVSFWRKGADGKATVETLKEG